MRPDDSESSAAKRFDALFRRLNRPVFAWLVGQTVDRDTAADLTQETFVRVWRHIARAPSSPREQTAWIIAIARNALIDHGRRKGTRVSLLPAARGEFEADAAAGPHDRAVTQDAIQRLDEAIGALPVDLRTVLLMSALGEMTSEQIGEALSLPAGTVRSRLHKARHRLAHRTGLS